MSPVEDKIYEVHDPSAGSGSLVLHLANELGRGSFGDKAQVYTQDISGKSTRFLRINMLLNGLTNSLDNIIEGDTLDSDFENDVNPFDEEATKYKLPRHEESIKKRCRKLEERIEDIKEGEKTGNHRKEE